ncbi:MAG: DNA phosphorothioation-dependent restriction protein DptG [Clostridium sp.]
MQRLIDEVKFGKNYEYDKGTIKHNSPKNIVVFPYNTKYEKKNKENVEEFVKCLASFSRNINNKTSGEEPITIEHIKNIIENVDADTSDKLALRSLVRELFFNANGELDVFNPMVLNYIPTPKNDYNEKLAKYLFDVLLSSEEDSELIERVEKYFGYESENVLELLVIKSLPKLKDSKSNKVIYKCLNNHIANLFKEDLKFILGQEEVSIKEFELLLKFYYFVYVSQTAIKLSNMFDANKEKSGDLYFTLDFEKGSKSRDSYIKGWKLLESHVSKIFAHAHTLEILNLDDNREEKLDYLDIKQIIECSNQEDVEEIFQNINTVKNMYVSAIKDVDWTKYNTSVKYEDNVQQSIYDFFMRIDYQFKKTTRFKPYTCYYKWFEEFCKINYLKKRGSLGYTLSITKEQLLFMTKISIGSKNRIKLKDLFKEFRKRGIFFDRESEVRITELFEKLNLIEKKSDSGDAQYVKAIL